MAYKVSRCREVAYEVRVVGRWVGWYIGGQ